MPYLGNPPAVAYSSTVKDYFNGDASTTSFTMSLPSTTNNVRVVVENVIQDPGVAYTCSGTSLNFTSAPPFGTANIYVIHLGPAVQTVVPPAEITSATTYTSDLTVQGAFTSQGIDDNATSTALTLDSSGKLLVGTTSSNQDAAFVATDSGSEVGFSFRNNATATNTASALYLQSWTADSTQAGASKISSIKDSSTYGTDLVFYTTTGSAGNTTEALRITADQRLLIGKNKAGAGSISTLGLELGTSYGMFARSGGSPMFIGRAVSTGNLVDFYWGSSTPTTFVGSISTNGSTTSYNTSSDYRLKENVTELTGAIDRIKQVPVHRFNFVADPDTTVDGFLAHEVADVVPEAIHGEKDAMRNEEYEVTPAVIDDDGNVVTEAVMGTREVPEYQGIDQSKLVPLLTAALKEQQAMIEDLQTRLAALETP